MTTDTDNRPGQWVIERLAHEEGVATLYRYARPDRDSALRAMTRDAELEATLLVAVYDPEAVQLAYCLGPKVQIDARIEPRPADEKHDRGNT